MTKIKWDAIGERRFETGVDRGVLYPSVGPGVPWNGLVSVKESPEGGEASPLYLDGIKYYNEASREEFVATIEAFTYPDEFENIDGTYTTGGGLVYHQQSRKPFGMSYRTAIGDDIKGLDKGYKIHLIYNALSSPTDSSYGTTNSNGGSAETFSWGVTATPEIVSARLPTAHFVIDSTRTDSSTLTILENILYGSPKSSPRLPTSDELVTIYNDWPYLQINANSVTGLAQLSYRGYRDLRGNHLTGLYKADNFTRLRKTTKPGLYIMEQ